jgi:WD40 repeat protein
MSNCLNRPPAEDFPIELAPVGALEVEKPDRASRVVAPSVAPAVAQLAATLKYGDANANIVLQTLKQTASADGRAVAGPDRQTLPPIIKPFSSLRCLDFSYDVRRLLIHPDGQTMATVGSPTEGGTPAQTNTIRLWNWVTGEAVAALTGHDAPILAIALSADGNYLVSGSADHTVKVWHWATGQAITLRGHVSPVTAVAISAAGETVVSAGCHQYVTANGSVKTVVADRGLRVWQVSTGREIQRWPAMTDAPTLSISPAGDRLLRLDPRPQVQSFTAATQSPAQLPPGRWLQFTPNWQTLATLVGETVLLHDLGTGNEISRFRFSQQRGDRLQVTALSPDGKFFAGGYQTTERHPQHGNYLTPKNHLKIWDATTGTLLDTLTEFNPGLWQTLKFSTDSKRLFSSVGNQIRVWGMNTSR